MSVCLYGKKMAIKMKVKINKNISVVIFLKSMHILDIKTKKCSSRVFAIKTSRCKIQVWSVDMQTLCF